MSNQICIDSEQFNKLLRLGLQNCGSKQSNQITHPSTLNSLNSQNGSKWDVQVSYPRQHETVTLQPIQSQQQIQQNASKWDVKVSYPNHTENYYGFSNDVVNTTGSNVTINARINGTNLASVIYIINSSAGSSSSTALRVTKSTSSSISGNISIAAIIPTYFNLAVGLLDTSNNLITDKFLSFTDIKRGAVINIIEKCPNGKYTTDNHLTCKPCTTGYTCKDGKVQTLCRAGTYSNNTECLRCPINSVLSADKKSILRVPTFSADGWTSCVDQCPAGLWNSAPGKCAYCPKGTYSGIGSTSCTKCPRGTYSRQLGTANCLPCPENKYSGIGYSYCQPNEPWKFLNEIINGDGDDMKNPLNMEGGYFDAPSSWTNWVGANYANKYYLILVTLPGVELTSVNFTNGSKMVEGTVINSENINRQFNLIKNSGGNYYIYETNGDAGYSITLTANLKTISGSTGSITIDYDAGTYGYSGPFAISKISVINNNNNIFSTNYYGYGRRKDPVYTQNQLNTDGKTPVTVLVGEKLG